VSRLYVCDRCGSQQLTVPVQCVACGALRGHCCAECAAGLADQPCDGCARSGYIRVVAQDDPIRAIIVSHPFDRDDRKACALALRRAIHNLLDAYDWHEATREGNEHEAWAGYFEPGDLTMRLSTYAALGAFPPFAATSLFNGFHTLYASSAWLQPGTEPTSGQALEGCRIEGLKWRVGGNANGHLIGDHYVQTDDVVGWLLQNGGFVNA
jgi:hypothetical protein